MSALGVGAIVFACVFAGALFRHVPRQGLAQGAPERKRQGELIRFETDGEFSVNRDFINYHTHGLNRPFNKRFVEAFGPQRENGEPIAERHRDLAYALQQTVEETILHVVRALATKHKSRNLSCPAA